MNNCSFFGNRAWGSDASGAALGAVSSSITCYNCDFRDNRAQYRGGAVFLLDSAFEQIRLYAKADMAVSLRLLRALADIGSSTPVPEIRADLAERGRRIVDGCAEKLSEHELRQMRSRLETLEKIAATARE